MKPLLPEPFVAREPLHGCFHRRGIEPAAHRASGLSPLDQVGGRKHVEMLHHCRQRHGKRGGNFAYGEFAFTRQTLDDGPPRRVGECRKRAIELCAVLKVNHSVN